ncbi:hypothetical protein CEXT_718951 [Caerostris extrusa]|uniref:Uncharacterized protein n=1 Tax=Caerostris extrusa TaxID=172846 RepID=A0AAV4V307_CAEEX|nr:hypothetical protein CEXT_718951 [Caerostris extrusa]
MVLEECIIIILIVVEFSFVRGLNDVAGDNFWCDSCCQRGRFPQGVLFNHSADKKIQNIIPPYALQHHTSYLISKDTEERIALGTGGGQPPQLTHPSSNPLTKLQPSPKVVGHLLPGLLCLSQIFDGNRDEREFAC